MFNDVTVIGAGRAGTAIAARLRERGVRLREDAELRLLCVPDSAIAEVAAAIEPGPWVAHVSGATPLAALAPHQRRFSVHPLQTLVRSRGPEQLDGAWAAVTAEWAPYWASPEAAIAARAYTGSAALLTDYVIAQITAGRVSPPNFLSPCGRSP